MKKFMPHRQIHAGANVSDSNLVYGTPRADHGAGAEAVRRQSDPGNVMKQAAGLKDFAPDTLIPGIKINTSATTSHDRTAQMMQFKGGQWELFGDIISAETGG